MMTGLEAGEDDVFEACKETGHPGLAPLRDEYFAVEKEGLVLSAELPQARCTRGKSPRRFLRVWCRAEVCWMLRFLR